MQDICLTPNECVAAQVQIDGDVATQMQPLLAEGDKALIEKRGLQMLDNPTKMICYWFPL